MRRRKSSWDKTDRVYFRMKAWMKWWRRFKKQEADFLAELSRRIPDQSSANEKVSSSEGVKVPVAQYDDLDAPPSEAENLFFSKFSKDK